MSAITMEKEKEWLSLAENMAQDWKHFVGLCQNISLRAIGGGSEPVSNIQTISLSLQKLMQEMFNKINYVYNDIIEYSAEKNNFIFQSLILYLNNYLNQLISTFHGSYSAIQHIVNTSFPMIVYGPLGALSILADLLQINQCFILFYTAISEVHASIQIMKMQDAETLLEFAGIARLSPKENIVDLTLDNSHLKTLEAKNDTHQFIFEEKEVVGDGNCALYSLRFFFPTLTRARFVHDLLSFSDDIAVRKSYAKVIEDYILDIEKSQEVFDIEQWQKGKKLLKDCSRANELLDVFRSALKTHFAHAENIFIDENGNSKEDQQVIEKLKQQKNLSPEVTQLIEQFENIKNNVETIQEKKEKFLTDKSTFIVYISDLVIDKKWIDTESMCLYATKNKIQLHIWQKENTQLKEISCSRVANPSQEAHVLFLKANHFNALNVVKKKLIQVPQVIEETVSSTSSSQASSPVEIRTKKRTVPQENSVRNKRAKRKTDCQRNSVSAAKSSASFFESSSHTQSEANIFEIEESATPFKNSIQHNRQVLEMFKKEAKACKKKQENSLPPAIAKHVLIQFAKKGGM